MLSSCQMRSDFGSRSHCSDRSYSFTTMVCKKCEKKLTAVAAPDKWKEGAKNAKGTWISFKWHNAKVINCWSAGQEGRKINQNKLLSKSAKLRQAARFYYSLLLSSSLIACVDSTHTRANVKSASPKYIRHRPTTASVSVKLPQMGPWPVEAESTRF